MSFYKFLKDKSKSRRAKLAESYKELSLSLASLSPNSKTYIMDLEKTTKLITECKEEISQLGGITLGNMVSFSNRIVKKVKKQKGR